MATTATEDRLPTIPAREAALMALDLTIQGIWWEYGCQCVRTLANTLAYADWRRSRMQRDSPRRKPVNVPELVEQWLDVLVGLSTAHDPEARTRADHDTDELLGPLLIAPIGQIREFARSLAARLEADERVPFLVWSSFRKVVEPIIAAGPESAAIELRKQLAEEIAALVARDLNQAELVAAIAGALQWRDPAKLEAVKTGLEAGGKPRIRGRESCLFLEVGDALVVL